MLCPECQVVGLKSTLFAGRSESTVMHSTPFYDEEGVYHANNRNTTTTEYRCSQGHDLEGKRRGGHEELTVVARRRR